MIQRCGRFLLAWAAVSSAAAGEVAPQGEPAPRARQESLLEKYEERTGRVIRYYQPIYFAYGRPSTKIQFSFRSPISESFPLNLAYTQVIFWQLHEPSKPFLDATYNPEIFYRWSPSNTRWGAVDFGLWEHNSNGRAGGDSRSYNQSYVRGVYATEWDAVAFGVAAKLRYLYHLDRTNEDIRDYVGPLDIDLRFLRRFDAVFDQAELILTLRPGGRYGTDLDHGGYQVATRFHVKGLGIDPAFYVQYYRGYAETLINYNRREDEFRIGLMF